MTAKIPRAHERRPVLWDAKLHQGGRIWECEAVDACPGGVKIRIEERLAINSRVVLAIDHLGSFQGEVLWQTQEFAGIRFLEDPDVVEEHLQGIPRTKAI